MTLIPTVRKQTYATFRQTPPAPPNSLTPSTCCNRSREEGDRGGGLVSLTDVSLSPTRTRRQKRHCLCQRATLLTAFNMRNSPRNLPVRMCARFHVFAWTLERVTMLVVPPARGSRLTPPLITGINQVIQFHWLINQSGGSAQTRVLPPQPPIMY